MDLARPLLLILVVGVLAMPSVAPAAQKGVVTDITWGIDEASKQKVAQGIATAGAQWATVDVDWDRGEPARGQFSEAFLSEVEHSIDLVRGAGARVLVTVAHVPEWASGSSNWRVPPKNPEDLGKFFGEIVRRFGADVDAWQIWNEPNHPHYWVPDPWADPDQCAGYAKLVKVAYPVIKSLDPTATVLFGALAFNDHPYLERCYALVPDIGSFFDAISTHPYAYGGLEPEAVKDSEPADGRLDHKTFLAYREIRKTSVAHGDPKPIWFTEFSWSTATDGHVLGNVTLEQQADYLTRSFKLLESDPYVEVAIWYGLRNWPYSGSEGYSWAEQLGLLNHDFSPKPAYHAFTAYTPPAPPPGGSPGVQPDTGAQTGTGSATEPAPAGGTSQGAGKVTLRVRHLRAESRAARRSVRARVRLSGTAAGARSGSVKIFIVRRGARAGWRVLRARIGPTGRFARTLKLRRGKAWRAWALDEGSGERQPGSSPILRFRTRRLHLPSS